MTPPALLYGYDIKADGTATAITQADASPSPGTHYRWRHFDLAGEGVRDWIASQTDPLVADALTREDTRPRCTPHSDGLIVILRGVNLNPNSDPEDMVSIRLFVTETRIISTRIRKLMAVTRIREDIDAGRAPADPGQFLARLGQGLTERMDPVVCDLADRIDALEEQSLDRTVGLRRELADIRRTTIVLRRYIAPQKEALWKLAQGHGAVVSGPVLSALRETGDQVTRLVEELDAVRERSAILNDQLTDKRAEEMNATMLLLSVVAAIFLPLGFLTGLLGINVGGMPGADSTLAFWIVCAACLGIGATLVWLFRRRGWI
jgi:zinc transporter